MPYSELYIGSALLADSFATGLANKWTLVTGTWSTNLSGFATSSAQFAGTISSLSTFSDFILSFRARMNVAPADTTSWFGVDIRKTSASDTVPATGYRIYLRYNGSLEVFKGGVGVVTTIATGITPSVWTHIKVIASGSSIKVYVNNSLWITYSDASFTTGFLSCVTFSNSPTVDFEGLLMQGVSNEFTSLLSESKDSLAATGLATFNLKLAGRPKDIQGPGVVSWPLLASSDALASGSTIVSGSYISTQVQDGVFVDIAPGASLLNYHLKFGANTLHNFSKLIITAWAKRGAASGNPINIWLFFGGGSLVPDGGDVNILGTTNTRYTATFTANLNQFQATDGTIEVQFISGNGAPTSDLLLDYCRVDYFRQGEFLAQETYILHNGRPTFGGITEDQAPTLSEQGYLEDLTGSDFGWLLPKRLFTQDYGSAVPLDQIVRDILVNIGSGLTYAGSQNVGTPIQQNFENENALQLLLKISNFALYDYRIDFSKVFIFRPRGISGGLSTSTSPTEAVNIRSAKTPHSLKEMRNEIIVYFNKPSYNPSDSDSWTNLSAIASGIFAASGTIAGLTATGKVTSPPGVPSGASAYVDMNWNNPPSTTFMQCYIFLNPAGVAPFNLRAWETLNFWFTANATGTSFIAFTVTLMKIATLAGWSRTFNVSGFPANTWVLIGGDAGVQVPTVANPRGWTVQGTPANNNIDTIMFSWFIQTGQGDIYVSGFNFNRAYSIVQVDDLASQQTYGLRGAYTYDKTRTDLTSATLLATGELAVKKYPSRKLEITVLGDETLQPAENIYISMPSLNIGTSNNIQQELYSIREVSHQWSKNGFLTDLKLTDMLIAGLDVEDITKMLKDEILFTDRAAKGGTGGIVR